MPVRENKPRISPAPKIRLKPTNVYHSLGWFRWQSRTPSRQNGVKEAWPLYVFETAVFLEGKRSAGGLKRLQKTTARRQPYFTLTKALAQPEYLLSHFFNADPLKEVLSKEEGRGQDSQESRIFSLTHEASIRVFCNHCHGTPPHDNCTFK